MYAFVLEITEKLSGYAGSVIGPETWHGVLVFLQTKKGVKMAKKCKKSKAKPKTKKK